METANMWISQTMEKATKVIWAASALLIAGSLSLAHRRHLSSGTKSDSHFDSGWWDLKALKDQPCSQRASDAGPARAPRSSFLISHRKALRVHRFKTSPGSDRRINHSQPLRTLTLMRSHSTNISEIPSRVTLLVNATTEITSASIQVRKENKQLGTVPSRNTDANIPLIPE